MSANLIISIWNRESKISNMLVDFATLFKSHSFLRAFLDQENNSTKYLAPALENTRKIMSSKYLNCTPVTFQWNCLYNQEKSTKMHGIDTCAHQGTSKVWLSLRSFALINNATPGKSLLRWHWLHRRKHLSIYNWIYTDSQLVGLYPLNKDYFIQNSSFRGILFDIKLFSIFNYMNNFI